MGRPEVAGDKLISNLSPRSPVVECYRIVRTNLQFLEVEKPLRSILITSATPQEGKTLTASNLAIIMAEAGNQVVLLDADFRKSQLHRLFGLDNKVGLTTVLTGEARLSDALKQAHVPNLHVLTAGPKPPNPAELLGSSRMAAILADLAGRVQTVILDSPPVMVVTDAVVLSTMVDGVALVLKANGVTYQDARKGKAMLEQVRARILGVILDQVPSSSVESYHYYYVRGRRRRQR